MRNLEAKITYESVETALRVSNNQINTLPKHPNELEDFLFKSYRNLFEQIYLLNPEIVRLFQFEGQSDNGEVKMTSIKDCYDVIARGLLMREDFTDLMEEKLIFPQGKEVPYLEHISDNEFNIMLGNELQKSLKIDLHAIKGADFIFLPTRFYERLNNYKILNGEFLKEVLSFVKTQDGETLNIEEFLKLCKIGDFFHLILAYNIIFFIISSISGLKKKWIL